MLKIASRWRSGELKRNVRIVLRSRCDRLFEKHKLGHAYDPAAFEDGCGVDTGGDLSSAVAPAVPYDGTGPIVG